MSDENKNNNSEVHEYDGIIEHDHPLPRWWVLLFYGTVIFAVCYYTYFEWMGGPTLDQELNAELVKIQALQKEVVTEAEGNLKNKLSDPDFIKVGTKVYAEKCFMCHGDRGQGTIGPNLTDKFWIHGGKPENLLKTIQAGVPDKGMPPWGSILSSDEQIAVVAFIVSLKDSNPQNPKAPQGDEMKE